MTSHAENEYQATASADRKVPNRNRRKASYIITEADEFFLGQLPASFVEILRQEGSMEEIAQRLSIAPGTVKSRTHRARAALDRLRAEARRVPPQ
jgi:DNA-binding NarL/FixJ family response regulator